MNFYSAGRLLYGLSEGVFNDVSTDQPLSNRFSSIADFRPLALAHSATVVVRPSWVRK